MIKNWVGGNGGHPVLVIRYEDMARSPVTEVKKMLSFLNMEFNEETVEQRLVQDFTLFHRSKKRNRDVYSKSLKEFVYSVLNECNDYLKDNNLLGVVQTSHYRH